MNLFDLGGQLLRVGRAVTPPGDRNLGAGGVPQAMPRFDHITISKLSCDQLPFLQCICSSSCSSDCQDPSDGRSGDKFGSGRFETCTPPGQTCSFFGHQFTFVHRSNLLCPTQTSQLLSIPPQTGGTDR